MNRLLRRYLHIFLLATLSFWFYSDSSNGVDIFSEGSPRVLLLTAHPDDECMFFAPTILHLVQTSVSLYSLCLSIGDAEGLGDIRRSELRNSLQVLGIPSERSWIVNHPLLQDNFTQYWNPQVVTEVAKPYIISHNINLILTFDDRGVSQHPNHVSLLHGASYLLRSSSTPQARLFTLKTVSVPHKYIGPTANPLSKLNLLFSWTSGHNAVCIAGSRNYLTALRAMYQHQSQLVWFRWLYVLFSRYMWVNEWEEVQVNQGGKVSIAE